MSDFPNLRENFAHVLREASLADVEVMLRCLVERLDTAHPYTATLILDAADSLKETLHVRRAERRPAPPATAEPV